MRRAAVAPGAPIDGDTRLPLDGARSCVYPAPVPVAIVVMEDADVPNITMLLERSAGFAQLTVID